MKAIQSNGYPVVFNDSLNELARFIAAGNYSGIFILVDTLTEKHCLPKVQAALGAQQRFDLIEIDPGEENKNIDFCIGIWKMLLDFGADRNSLLINLGGGVVTDMGSFAAATFKRGIDFVQVPTTLLAQVDASVGGKTGIDMDGVKNIIGTFSQPKAVFIDAVFLQTLDERQLVSGFAEVIKHGLIYDSVYWEKLRSTEPGKVTTDLIYRSIQIKNEVVTADPYEKGLRKILNFGHTIGHAVESYSLTSTTPLVHGEAIAIGMICEAWLSHELNGLPAGELEQITDHILSVFPAYDLKTDSFPQLISYMQNDKKNQYGKIGVALLEYIGRCSYGLYADEAAILQSLEYYCEVANV